VGVFSEHSVVIYVEFFNVLFLLLKFKGLLNRLYSCVSVCYVQKLKTDRHFPTPCTFVVRL